jgi:hypothetical protein
VVANNLRSQITIFDVPKFTLMLVIGLCPSKVGTESFWLHSADSVTVGFLSLPVLLGVVFALLDRRKPPPRSG